MALFGASEEEVQERERAAVATAMGQSQRREEQRQRRLEEERAAREAALQRGRARGQELFGEGALGRVEAERSKEISDILGRREDIAATAGTRSEDMADIVARRRAALEGMAAPEAQVLRQQALQQIGRGEESALRRLRGVQAAQGLRGGTAAAQQVQLLAQGQAARTQAEQELFLQDLAQKKAALGAFETTVTGAEATEFGRQQQAMAAHEAAVQQARQDELNRKLFNIQQQQSEKFGQLATEFGFAQMSGAERAAVGQELLGEQFFSAFGGGGPAFQVESPAVMPSVPGPATSGPAMPSPTSPDSMEIF